MRSDDVDRSNMAKADRPTTGDPPSHIGGHDVVVAPVLHSKHGTLK